MNRQEDICAKCVHDQPNYTSVFGNVPHCCDKHWHCVPARDAKDHEPKGAVK